MTQSAIAVTDQDHVQGPADAAVTLVEYGDYESAACKLAYWVVHGVQQQMGKGLRRVFRNFPLPTGHPHAQHAAEAAEAAGEQGQFWPMHDYLYEHQQKLGNGYVIAFARELGMDADRFEREIAEHRYASRVHTDIASGIVSGVNGTPTFFINGLRHDGALDYGTLLAAIEAAK